MFLDFLLHIWNLHQVMNILKKRWSPSVVCFGYYRLQNMCLIKCVKSLVSEHLPTVNMLTSLKNCNRAVPSYCFMNLEKVEWENIRLSVSEIGGVFFNVLTADDKYSLHNMNNLSKQTELQLSKKQKLFS